jgi:hypothetical protein
MKRLILIIGIVTLLLTICLSGCSERGIHISKISGEPENSVNMTEQQMEKFPHLKDAILTDKSANPPEDELIRLRAILDFFNTSIIKYQNEYYEIYFFVD